MKLSQLPPDSSPALLDYLIGIQNSSTTDVKFTLQSLIALIGSNSIIVSSNPYKFSVYRAGAWTVDNGSLGIVNFDTKTFDTSSNVDIVTHVGRFTAPQAGFYFFTSAVQAAANNYTVIAIFKNGSEFKRGTQWAITSTIVDGLVVSGLVWCAAGDYIEIAFQGTGGAGNVGSNLTYYDGLLECAS